MDSIKNAAQGLVLASLKAVKVVVFYMIPSALIIALSDPNAVMIIQDRLQFNFDPAELMLVNGILVALVDALKRSLPEDWREWLTKYV